MDKTIAKSTANGTVMAPPSKSMAHRYIICAALANGVSTITNVDFSEDIKATIDCIQTLGAKVTVNESSVTIDGSCSILNDANARSDSLKYSQKTFSPQEILDKFFDMSSENEDDSDSLNFMCRESGSTMRFFMGIAMTLPFKCNFFGSDTLRNRPFGIYEDILNSPTEKNTYFKKLTDKNVIKGGVKGNEFKIEGNVSSQFVTGLLLALSLMKEGGSVELIPPVESRSYIDMTIQAMREFNIEVDWESELVLRVNPGQMYFPTDIEVEGDYSNAAFLDAFNYLGGDVTVTGLKDDSLQGDRVYKEYFDKLMTGKAIVDIADCPDLGPVLFAVAAANHGGVFTSTARLKIKESDRGSVMCQELSKFGVKTTMVENQIEIEGGTLNIPSEILCGHNDHRIVMSLTLLLTKTGGRINDAEAVRKSYPGFFDDIKKLGVSVSD